MLKTAAFAAFVVVIGSLLIAGPLLARNYGNQTRQRAWVGGTQNPQDFPNCILWSPRDRNYVWICGPPYPEGFIHR